MKTEEKKAFLASTFLDDRIGKWTHVVERPSEVLILHGKTYDRTWLIIPLFLAMGGLVSSVVFGEGHGFAAGLIVIAGAVTFQVIREIRGKRDDTRRRAVLRVIQTDGQGRDEIPGCRTVHASQVQRLEVRENELRSNDDPLLCQLWLYLRGEELPLLIFQRSAYRKTEVRKLATLLAGRWAVTVEDT